MGNSQSEKLKTLQKEVASLKEEMNDAKEDRRREALLNMTPNNELGNTLIRLCYQTGQNRLTPGPSTNALLIVYHFRCMFLPSTTTGSTGSVQYSEPVATPLNGSHFDSASAREVIKQLVILLEICIQFEKDYTEWDQTRAKTIRCLTVVSERLDECETKAQKTKIAGATTGLASSAMIITGFALAPITFGGSITLSVVGGVVGVAAAGTNIGGEVVKRKEDKPLKKEIAECLEEDAAKTFKLIKLINKFVDQMTLVREALGMPDDYSQIEAMQNPFLKDQARWFCDIAATARNAAHSVGTICNLIDDPARALTAARVGSYAVAIPLAGIAAAIDLAVLIKNGYDLSTGKGSDLAKQIRDEILPKIGVEAVRIHDFRSTMSSNACGDQAGIQNVNLPIIALEWHPELTDAQN